MAEITYGEYVVLAVILGLFLIEVVADIIKDYQDKD